MNAGCAGKTVRSLENACRTWAPKRCDHAKALHKSTFTLPYLTYDNSSTTSDVQCSTLVFHSPVMSLVMPRHDYGNATLVGLPASQLHWLQPVLNAATRLIHWSWYERITPMLWDLYGCSLWRGLAQLYLSDYIQYVADSNCHHFQSSSSLQLVIWLHGCPLLAIMHFRCLEAASETVCHPTSPQSNAVFLEPPENLPLFPIISFLTVFVCNSVHLA